MSFHDLPVLIGRSSTVPTDVEYPHQLTDRQPFNVPGGLRLAQVRLRRLRLVTRIRPKAGRLRELQLCLQSEIGHPDKQYGCCTQVGIWPRSGGKPPGNKASAECS